jgi:hypothetical protein
MAWAIALMLSVASTEAIESGADGRRQQAEKHFRQGLALRARPDAARAEFRRAAEAYEELYQLGFRTPLLCRSMGHAWLLAGDGPRAILAYRRGLAQAPNDRKLQESLAYTREQVAYSAVNPVGQQPMDHWPPWLPRPTPTPLLLVALAAYTLGWLLATRWAMVRGGRLAALAITAFLVAALAGTGWGILQSQRQHQRAFPLVVIAEDVVARKGDGTLYPPRFDAPLPRGVEAQLRFERGDWLQIELAGGEVGWVPRTSVWIDR